MSRGGKQFNIFHFITTLCNKTQKKWMTEKRKKRLKSQFFVDYRVPDDDGEGNRSQIEISVLDALFSRHQYTAAKGNINFLNPGATRQKRLKKPNVERFICFWLFCVHQNAIFCFFPICAGSLFSVGHKIFYSRCFFLQLICIAGVCWPDLNREVVNVLFKPVIRREILVSSSSQSRPAVEHLRPQSSSLFSDRQSPSRKHGSVFERSLTIFTFLIQKKHKSERPMSINSADSRDWT